MTRPVGVAGTVWPAACGAMDDLGAYIAALWDQWQCPSGVMMGTVLGRLSCGCRRRIVVGLTGLVFAACSGDPSGGPDAAGDREAADPVEHVEPVRFEGGDFYTPPEPLPEGEPGTLLRYQPLEGVSIEGGTVWRVMYRSESLPGEPIAVTGIVVVPTAPAPPEGRRLVTVAHWSVGIADECAPSRDPNAAGLPLTAPFVAAGYVVALSDFEGLGTPGRHPWLVGESEGRSVLDAAEAATQLPGATVGDRYAIVGYSQGGHAALWANELAEDWGPDLDLVGAVAGAPVTELPASFTSRPEATGFFMSMVAGYQAAYPDADPARLLTDAGLAALDLVDQGCTGEVFAAVAARSREEQLRRPGDVPEEWVALLAANDPGQVAADSPVLILHSLTDELLPATTSSTSNPPRPDRHVGVRSATGVPRAPGPRQVTCGCRPACLSGC